jgi:hypothetical protein
MKLCAVDSLAFASSKSSRSLLHFDFRQIKWKHCRQVQEENYGQKTQCDLNFNEFFDFFSPV